MAVATMMAVVVMAVVHWAVACLAGEGQVMVGVPNVMVVMVVGMKISGDHHVLAQVPMQPRSPRPGELERNDEHEDEGNEATHGGAFYVDDSPAQRCFRGNGHRFPWS